ncbi:MAG: AraC family transcriptional regulator [Monoglobales bacterium]
MLDDKFKKRYRDIPLAIHEISPAKTYKEKSVLTLLHIHEEIEIIHITEGQAIVYLDGNEHMVKAGETLFVSPWCAHRAEILPGKFAYSCICFDSSLLGDLFEAKLIATGEKHLPTTLTSKSVSKSVNNIVSLCKKGDKGWAYQAQGEILKIFGEIVSNELLGDIKRVADRDFCLKVYSFIKDRFKDEITSRDCADSLLMDQSTFCRKFKFCFGSTFSQYLCAFRLERAKQLLEEGKYSVTEVGDMTGFAGTSYFIMKFKQIYNTTPYKIRRKQYEGSNSTRFI